MHTTQERSCNSAFVLPRNCTFSETDGKALASFWYPIAFSHEVTDRPFAAKLLDERLVLFRLSDSLIVAARDLCLHRSVPLSLGWVENDELQCKYHGVGYDKSGQCTRIPALPDATIILTKMHRCKTRWTLTIKCLAKIRTLLKNSIPKIYRSRCKMKSTLPGIKARSPIAKDWRHCI